MAEGSPAGGGAAPGEAAGAPSAPGGPAGNVRRGEPRGGREEARKLRGPGIRAAARHSAQPSAPLSSAGRNLKEWLREKFCDHPLEHCEDTRLHDAAYVGDLPTLKSLLEEESFQR